MAEREHVKSTLQNAEKDKCNTFNWSKVQHSTKIEYWNRIQIVDFQKGNDDGSHSHMMVSYQRGDFAHSYFPDNIHTKVENCSHSWL